MQLQKLIVQCEIWVMYKLYYLAVINISGKCESKVSNLASIEFQSLAKYTNFFPLAKVISSEYLFYKSVYQFFQSEQNHSSTCKLFFFFDKADEDINS